MYKIKSFALSQNDYPVSSYKHLNSVRLLARPHKFDGSFLIPKSITALASCTTSVYVNLSKNSFFMPPHLIFCAKASAKVQQIWLSSKFLGENFQKIQKVFGIHDNSELHLIHYNKGLFEQFFDFCISTLHRLVDKRARIISFRQIENGILIIS